jgi:hypothetical protein
MAAKIMAKAKAINNQYARKAINNEMKWRKSMWRINNVEMA